MKLLAAFREGHRLTFLYSENGSLFMRNKLNEKYSNFIEISTLKVEDVVKLNKINNGNIILKLISGD